MEEGKNKVEISYENMMALYKELSRKDVEKARLEMKHERLQEDFLDVKTQLATSETAKLEAEANFTAEREKNRLLEEKIAALQAKLEEQSEVSRQSEKELLQKALSILLKNNLLLSLLKIQVFVEKHPVDLTTAWVLRGFILECIPDELKPTVLGVLNDVLMLPESPKPAPPKIEQTITGGQTFFGNITNSNFTGTPNEERKEDEPV